MIFLILVELIFLKTATGCVLSNTRQVGFDLKGSEFSTTLSGCLDACKANVKCQAATYSPNKMCWPHGSIETKAHWTTNGFYLYVKHCLGCWIENTIQQGFYLQSMFLAKSKYGCLKLCDDNVQCQGVTYADGVCSPHVKIESSAYVVVSGSYLYVKQCEDVLDLRDFQLSASSFQKGYPPNMGRITDDRVGWCSEKGDLQPYFQVDFLLPRFLWGVTLRGWLELIYDANIGDKVEAREVDTFLLLYGNKTNNLTYYREYESVKLFQMNKSKTPGEVQTFELTIPEAVRYLRLEPTASSEKNQSCLKMDIIAEYQPVVIDYHCTRKSSTEVGVVEMDRILVSRTPEAEFHTSQFHDTSDACREACALNSSCIAATYTYHTQVCDLISSDPASIPQVVDTGDGVQLFWKLCATYIKEPSANANEHKLQIDRLMITPEILSTPMYPFEGFCGDIIWEVTASDVYTVVGFETIHLHYGSFVLLAADIRFLRSDYHNGKQPVIVSKFNFGMVIVLQQKTECHADVLNKFRAFVGFSDLPWATITEHGLTVDRINAVTDSSGYYSSNEFKLNKGYLATPSFMNSDRINYLESIAISFDFMDAVKVEFSLFQIVCDYGSAVRVSTNLYAGDSVEYCNLHRPPINLFLIPELTDISIEFRLPEVIDRPLQGFVANWSRVFQQLNEDCSGYGCFHVEKFRGQCPGAELNGVRNKEEYKVILNGLHPKGNNIYIIGTIIPPELGKKQLYHWSNGHPVIYTAWSSKYVPSLPKQKIMVTTTADQEEFQEHATCFWRPDSQGKTVCRIGAKATYTPMSLRAQLLYQRLNVFENHTNYFQCRSGEYISLLSTCDSSDDCLDTSDEQGCPSKNDCTGRFQCKDKSCVPYSVYCDHVVDCSDASDENCDFGTCDAGLQWQCSDGKCIDKRFRCNGRKQCADGSDEINCDVCDTSFTCFDGTCLLFSRVCDGFLDCPNAVPNDEESCTPTVRSCPDVWKAGKRQSGSYTIVDEFRNTLEYSVECNFERMTSERIIETIFQNVDFKTFKRFTPAYDSADLNVQIEDEFAESESIQTFQTPRPGTSKPAFLAMTGTECYQSFIQTCPPFRMIKASMLNLAYHREYWDCLCIERRIWNNGSSSWLACSDATLALQQRGFVNPEDYWVIDMPFRRLMQLGVMVSLPYDEYIGAKWSWNFTKIARAKLNGAEARIELFLGPLKCVHALDTPEIQSNLGCVRGKPVHRSGRCLSDYDEDGNVIGCRDLSHLQDCGSFRCPDGYVKCPNSFCLPIRFLCDGDVDCFHGEDEMECKTSMRSSPDCPGLFRCRKKLMCLPMSQVCDGVKHCPEGDDERLCHYVCPPGCTCSAFEVQCHHQDSKQILKLIDNKTRMLDLSGSNVEELQTLQLTSLAVLNATSCNMRSVYPDVFLFMRNLLVLDLSNNRISHLLQGSFNGLQKVHMLLIEKNHLLSTIAPGSFSGLSDLQTFRVSNTLVAHLPSGTFNGMGNLKRLDISNNRIQSIQGNAFAGLSNLSLLDITRNSIMRFKDGVFDGLHTLDVLKTDEYKFCCLKPSTVTDDNCFPHQDEFSSCSDLMRYEGPRALLWIIGILALVGNSLSMLYRIIFDRTHMKMAHGVFITNLIASDFLMGIYLIIIAGADLHYRGRYIWSDYSWRNSNLCNIAGILSALSSEASVLFICLITLDRILVTKYPLGNRKFTAKTALIASFVCWVLVSTVSILPVLYKDYFQNAFYSQSAVCLALPLTRKRPPGWTYSLLVFVVFNFLTFVLISIGQCVIYKEIKASKSKARSSNRINDLRIARNLLMVVATDFMCWFPIGVMGMMALSGQVISGDVYVWACVLILPVNSALNPFLYTFLAIIRRKRFVPRLDEHLATNEIDFSVMTKVLKMEVFVCHLDPDHKKLFDYMNSSNLTQKEIISIVWMTTCRLNFLHHFNMCLGSMTEQKIAIYEENKVCNSMSMTIMPKMARNAEDKQKDIQLLGEMARKLITSWKRKTTLNSGASVDYFDISSKNI